VGGGGAEEEAKRRNESERGGVGRLRKAIKRAEESIKRVIMIEQFV
jgi:hypothetical protein